MPADAARFVATFLGASPLPLALARGWSLTTVEPDRVRAGVALLLQREGAVPVVAYAEPRVDSQAAFARTRLVNLGYYGDPDSAQAPHLPEALRALVALLEHFEEDASEDWIAQVYRAESVETGRRTTEVEVLLARGCNLACRFCNTPAGADVLLADVDEALQVIADARRRGATGLTLTGREPTLVPRLPEVIGRARELGYDRVRVQTNGVALASRALVARLHRAGLTDVHLSVPTLDPATFRRLAGPAANVDELRQALANLLEAPLFQVYVLVVITTANLDELPRLIERLARDHPLAPGHVALSPVAPVGDALGAPDLWPSYAALATSLDAALRAAERWSLPVSVPARCGAPLCVIPSERRPEYEQALTDEGSIPEAGKARVAACAGCRVEARCAGPWTAVVARLGADGITPVR